jgi:DNA primase
LNPDKLFWPDEGYTKLDLVEFYAGIFPKLRPYVDDRILTMARCPDGVRGECFYRKEKPKGIASVLRLRYAVLSSADVKTIPALLRLWDQSDIGVI